MVLGFENRETNQRGEGLLEAPPTLTGKNDISRYIDIVQGCENFCSYCIVPYTRGPVCSKKPDVIFQEARALCAAGAREITLLGQNVNSYGLDLVKKNQLPPPSSSGETPFIRLLKELMEIPDLLQIRFTTSNPFDFTQSLADLFKTHPKMGRYIHLPLQSGSDSILTAMNRKITANEYLERISWLRSAVPDIGISTDFIVGFPGETDADFEATYKLVQDVKFSFVYSFKYSIRSGTPAATFEGQISEDLKERRLALLNKLQDTITMNQQQAEIGAVRTVLFHYESPKVRGAYYGRTEHFRLVRVTSEENLVGKSLPVKIVDGNKTALIGKCLK